MKKEKILQFIIDNFSNNRTNLIPLLNRFNWEDSVMQEIYFELSNNNTPFYSQTGISQEVKNNLKQKKINNKTLGDISDFYTVIFNTNVEKEDYLDNTNILKRDSEIHYCNIWINWFLPVYYIETCYIKLIDSNKGIQEGPLNELNNLEFNKVKNIHNILNKKGYSLSDFKFLKEEVKGINTDCFEEGDVSVFDCIYSDLHYYHDKLNRHIKCCNIPDPNNKKYYFKIIDYFDDDFKLIKSRKDRYQYR